MALTNEQIIRRTRQEGVSYAEFMALVHERLAETKELETDEQEQARHDYTALNLKRSERIERTYRMSAEMATALAGIEGEQLWLVITEGWCGDSAQILPYLSAAAAVNSHIEFRILERDDHLDVMDSYLTNGTRSIPKLIIFDESGNELANWGPRPQAAIQLIQELKEQLPRPELYEKLHLWYGRNRGKEIEAELMTIAHTVTNTATELSGTV